MATIKSKEINLLDGPLLPNIIKFVLPLMLANLLQVFYNAADMIVVGLSGVAGAVGSIGTTGPMINLIINLLIGCSVGANVSVARNLGARERGKTQRAVHTALCVGLLFGVISAVLGICVSRAVLYAMGNRGHILTLSVRYSRIYFSGLPFLALTNYLSAIFRAKGDTRTPLVVLGLAGLVNVVLNLFFVLACGMSVEGVAMATVCANVVSTVCLAWKLCRENGWCSLVLRKLRMHKEEFMEILRVGVPAGIQGALFSLSNILVQSSIIQMNTILCPGGSAVIDGNAAAGNLEGFVYTATNSVHQAAVTFTSQNYGAGKMNRIGKIMANCYFLTFVIAEVLGGGILLFSDQLVSLYVSDVQALDVGLLRNQILMTTYFVLGFMEVGSGLLRGLGRSVTSTVISLLGACVLRIAWISTVFQIKPALETVYVSYPITWAVTALVSFCAVQMVRKKLKHRVSLRG